MFYTSNYMVVTVKNPFDTMFFLFFFATYVPMPIKSHSMSKKSVFQENVRHCQLRPSEVHGPSSVCGCQVPVYILSVHTVCPESSDPFYIVSYYIKQVTTSWTHSAYWGFESSVLSSGYCFMQGYQSGWIRIRPQKKN